MADVVLHDEIVAAPHCSLNVPISRDRGFGVVRAELRELNAIKSALGGTVNNVILAAVSGGLRSLLIERGDDVGRTSAGC